MTHPKSFVAIPTVTPKGQPKSYLVAPVFHDGSSREGLISGEVRLSMTALTPFLPANDEIAFEDCLGVEAVKDRGLFPPPNWGLLTQEGRGYPLDPGKTLVEPLRMGKGDGRIVVPGARYKGMVGQSLGALFAAPFSRVAERTYSYRPNAVFPRGSKFRREPRPAIVVGETPEGGLEIRVLPFVALSRIVFVRSNAVSRIDPTSGARQRPAVQGVRIDADNGRNRLLADATAVTNLSGYTVHPYFGGVDGHGYMARLFNRGGDVYHHVLVDNDALPRQTQKVSKAVLDHHARTLVHLKSRKEGHLRRDHPLTHSSQFKQDLPDITAGIAAAAEAIRTRGQLIYVEVELDANGNISDVNSLGASYYYLWRCLDSVRTLMINGDPVARPITVPRPEEWPQDQDPATRHSPPKMLTMGRALLGYVSDDRNPGTAGIGKGDYTQMAGRFGFNNAIEVLQDGESGDTNDRFLMSEYDCVVPLRVLGAPRPSAAEHYIRQTAQKRVGYGESRHEQGGELSGYAFYAHQPDAADDPLIYSFARHERDNIGSVQSSLARFLSRPGRVFRVRLRFSDLRPWELAALLACLRPGLLDAPETHPLVAAEGQPAPRHAVKLGRGRPLGLGSLDISIDRVVIREGQPLDERALRAQFVALRTLLREAGLEQTMKDWLKVHEYAGKTRVTYPSKLKDREASIVAYYSDKTQEFLRARRAW